MARAFLSRTAEETLRSYSPGDQQLAARAIAFLENDETREADRVNLFLVEDDLRVWGLFVGSVFLAFVEDRGGDVTVIHVSLLSRFRYSSGEF